MNFVSLDPMKYCLSLVLIIVAWISSAQDFKSYIVYNQKGKESNFGKLLKASESVDIVLFGEHHDNPIIHWLQLELTKQLGESKNVVLGAEFLKQMIRHTFLVMWKGS